MAALRDLEPEEWEMGYDRREALGEAQVLVGVDATEAFYPEYDGSLAEEPSPPGMTPFLGGSSASERAHRILLDAVECVIQRVSR